MGRTGNVSAPSYKRYGRSPLQVKALGLCAFAAAAAASALSGAATDLVAAAPTIPVWQAQVLDLDQTGVAAPAGIAFSPASKRFYVLQPARRTGTPGVETEIAEVSATSSGSGRVGSARIAAIVADPVNVVFDGTRSRLLLLGRAGELLELAVTADGRLAPGSLKKRDVARLGVAAPSGIAVDPVTGAVFILDAAQPRLVRVDVGQDGGFDAATATEIDLRGVGLRDVRGLAYDPVSRNLFVRGGSDLYEITASGHLVSTRDLSGVDLVRPEGMVFGPSGDQTDDASEQSLYLADAGDESRSSGHVIELSLQAPIVAEAIDFTSTIVRTTATSTWDPPSPDPSGIEYVQSANRLVAVDGEVEETIGGVTQFKGANLWETSLSGSVVRSANLSTVQPTQAPITNEPTGIAFKPGSDGTARYFLSEDTGKRVLTVNPGGDGSIGTSDDSWTFFKTNISPNANTDPEGIAYDPVADRLFVADGTNAEIYEYTLSGTPLAHFDTERYGVLDPETVELNRETGTLFILSNRQSGPLIIETTKSGSLLQTIDVSAMTGVGGRKPAGLAIAPASNGSGASRFYVVDRGVDNDSNPQAVDGKLFELTMPTGSTGGNAPPTVSAGSDQAITLPSSAALDGTVSDDGEPNPPGVLTTSWSTVSGPGTVTFGDATAMDTTASFSESGVYVLRLTANDSALSKTDEVTVTVNAAAGGNVDVVFADGFESGTLAAWSSATTGGGDLSASAAAARSGAFGMQALINDNSAIFVTDDSPASEPRYRARFYLYLNAIAMASGNNFYLLQSRNGAGTVVVQLLLRRTGSQYELRAGVRQDGGGYTSSPWVALSASGWNMIEFDWRAATGAGANNGDATIWVDNVQRAVLSGVDNDSLRVESTRLGAVAGIETDSRGTIYFDAFESRKQTYIGP